MSAKVEFTQDDFTENFNIIWIMEIPNENVEESYILGEIICRIEEIFNTNFEEGYEPDTSFKDSKIIIGVE